MEFSVHLSLLIVTVVPDVNIRIELVQESLTYEEGRLLAWYESSARDFLYPYPSYSSSYGTHGRELLLERTLAFPVCSFCLSYLHDCRCSLIKSHKMYTDNIHEIRIAS